MLRRVSFIRRFSSAQTPPQTAAPSTTATASTASTASTTSARNRFRDPLVSIPLQSLKPSECRSYFSETIRMHRALVSVYEHKTRSELPLLNRTPSKNIYFANHCEQNTQFRIRQGPKMIFYGSRRRMWCIRVQISISQKQLRNARYVFHWIHFLLISRP